MDKCSTELLTLICERACADNFGHTARSLGIVPKYFRAIAEPIELRTLIISGMEQLRGVLAKVERTRASIPDIQVEVQHLFISELKMEHALAEESLVDGFTGFMDTEEGCLFL